jgi:hypothetical protein
MTRVVHCKKDSYDVYIGRSKDTFKGKFGNPFSHKEGTLAKFKVASRKEAINKFREYLLSLDKNELDSILNELKGKTLGCWCKPKLCHGDVYVELINNLEKNLF